VFISRLIIFLRIDRNRGLGPLLQGRLMKMAVSENKLAFDGGWGYDPAPESTDHIKVKSRYGLFINGEFVKPEKGKYFDTVNPATEEKLSRVADASRADVDKAVKAAREAYRGP